MSSKEATKRWQLFTLTTDTSSNIPSGLGFSGTYVISAPNGSGVRCLYVGQSGNVGRRLRDHIKMGRYSSGWVFKQGQYRRLKISVKQEAAPFERMMTEARLIDRLKPSLNKLPAGAQVS